MDALFFNGRHFHVVAMAAGMKHGTAPRMCSLS